MKKSLLLMLFLALTWAWTAKADELTVYEGTTQNSYVPAYMGYFDDFTRTQTVIPAADLENMAGASISAIKFYTTNSNIPYTSVSTVDVYLKEFSYATISAFEDKANCTMVYQGTLDIVAEGTGGALSITFSAPFVYQGGNLLIGIENTTDAGFKFIYFYGQTVNGASVGGYNSTSLANVTPTQRNFIPKTTFEYTIEAPSTCEKPSSLVASDVEANSAVLTWDGGSGTYNVEYKKASAQIWTSVLGSSNLTTTSLSNLEPLTSYQARVQSVCTEDSSSYKMVSFTTPCGAYPIPFSYGFEVADTFSCWTPISGTVARVSGTTHSGSYRLDFRGTTSNMIAFPSFSDAINTLRLEFWTRPESTGGNSGKFAIGYMTDISDASTFVAVETYNSTEMTTSYVKKIVDFVNAPAGANIAMRQFDCSTNYYWYVDDITVKAIPSCLEPTDLSVSKIKQTEADLSWTANSNESSWMVYYKKATAEVFDSVAVSSNSFTLNGLEAATNYQFYVVAKCSATDESEASAIASFTTACPEFYAVPFVENFDKTASAANSLPICWDYINTTSYSSYSGYPRVYNGSTSSLTGNNHLRFNSYMSASSTTADPKDQYAILPKMDNIKGLRMKLFARANSASTSSSTYDATFHVGVMTDPTNAGSFESMGSYTPAGTNYELFTIPFGDYSGGSDGGGYIAIKIEAAEKPESGSFYRSVFIDSIVVEEMPSCLEPVNLALASGDSIGTNFAILQWTSQNESHESAWKLEYKLASAADWTALPEAVSSNPYTLQGLQHSSIYEVRVAAWCDPSNPDAVSGWSEPISFQTECAAISQFPWSEDFESHSTGDFAAPCWVNEHISGSGSKVFGVSTTYSHGSSTKQLNLPDMSNGTLTKLSLPQMILPSADYQFVLDVYRNASGTSYPEEGIRVFASTDGEIAGATELAFISRNFTQTDSNLIPVESKAGWYTYELPIGISGSCYIILRGESKYGSATYIDNFSVEAIPSCKRPSSPKSIADLLTAHTATLTWTMGDSLQTAWQIAVDTLASFNPDSVGIRIVNASKDTFKINGLDANTQYYAYVRANCEENSPWSRTNVSFKTVIGNKVPTNLAVIDSTITSSAATIKWQGVATNDYHQSFELYYSLSNSDPNPSNAQNIITGITDTLYALDNLESDTTYYIWVRDNCGTDSLSAWSPRKSFKTASACETPDGLDANEIGVDSAIISWNTYGLTDFKLRYKADTAGAEWSNPVEVAQPHVLSGLAGNTVYKVQVQPTCAEATVWSDSMSFRTDCEAVAAFPWSEDFESYSASSSGVKFENPCWENIHLEGTGTYFFEVYSGTAAGSNSTKVLRLHDMSSGTMTKLRLPAMTLPNENYQFVLDVYRNNEYNTKTGEGIRVFVSTDGEIEGATELAFIPRVYSLSNSVIPAESEAGWYTYELPIGIGGSCYVILRGESEFGAATYMDNFKVREIPSCLKPTNLAVSNITSSGASLSWTAGGTETAWQYAYVEAGEEAPTAFENAQNPTVDLTGLTANKSYDFYVRANCSDDKSETAMLSFKTSYGLPFAPEFSTTTIPADWGKSSTPADDVFAGTAMALSSYSSWSIVAADTVIGAYHFRGNIYGGSWNYWVVTPAIDLSSASAGDLLILNFEAGLTAYSSSKVSTMYTGEDDRFIVAVSADGGATWSQANATEWNNSGSEHVYNDIPTHGKMYQINMSAFAGQVVKIGFYGESTVSNADNYFHFGKINLHKAEAYDLEIDESLYATYYNADDAFTMPENLTGHVFSTENTPKMLVQEYEAGDIVPAATPLVIEATAAGNYSLVPAIGGAAPEAESQLVGVNEVTSAIETSSAHQFFVLSLNSNNDAGSIGFYYYDADHVNGGFPMVKAHKAYLKVPTDKMPSGNNAAGRFFILNGENGATWLENLEGVEGTLKFLHEGKIFILREGVIYDATGRKVMKL